MTKYFIEREDGMWLTDLLYVGDEGAFTKHPFRAWAFEELHAQGWIDLQRQMERKLLFGIPDTEASKVINWLLEEECCTKCRVSKQTFEDKDGIMTHTYKNKRGIEITRVLNGTTYIKDGLVTFVHLPGFDQPIENYYT